MEKESRRIAMAVDRAVSALGLGKMVEAAEVPRRTVQNDMEGISTPTTARLLTYVRALDEAGLREVSAQLLDDILGLVGREARPVAQICPDIDPAHATMRMVAEVGDAVRWAEEALQDGMIDYAEAAEGERELRHARHAVDTMAAIVAGAAARTPQRALPGAR